ncbi:universal stress protein [Methylotenera sp.]|uniref:universal stress protein n=1 Tax=Methylotenera sp. TaxID=2051956 RepID=UPI00273373EE|nr:universal stress protein [Methylotenera sp.]MDP3211764.1 universal stress protein [Methylotenera sp.]
MQKIQEYSKTTNRLLLATDLSARCDRALYRAVHLAHEWQAELIALNVFDVTSAPDQALAWLNGVSDEELLQMTRKQLAYDLRALHANATLRVLRSQDITSAIQQEALRSECSVVVTGVSQKQSLGRYLLGSTVENLARLLVQPLLVVRKQTHGPYQRIVVATDFSDASRKALLTAAKLFPNRELILYHARATAGSGLAKTSPNPALCVSIEQTECAAFLAATEIPGNIKVHPVVECGAVESTLASYVRKQDIDLVVMGSRGQNSLATLLLGSTATKLLDWLPCDTLLVR